MEYICSGVNSVKNVLFLFANGVYFEKREFAPKVQIFRKQTEYHESYLR